MLSWEPPLSGSRLISYPYSPNGLEKLSDKSLEHLRAPLSACGCWLEQRLNGTSGSVLASLGSPHRGFPRIIRQFLELEFSEVRGSKHPIGRGGKHSTTAQCTGPPASSLRQTPPTFLRAPTSWATRKARGIAGSGESVQVPGRLPRPFLSDAPIHWGTWKRLSRKVATHACNTSKSSGPPCLLEWWPC
jgi:hypothetical protein